MNKPKISVVMPFYNREKIIADSIQSALNQTFADFELLLINDGSTDKSLEIAKSFADPRIRIIENEKNLGIAAARNRGLSESRGEYIAMLDSDDLADKRRLKLQNDFLDSHSDFAIVGSFVKLIDENRHGIGVSWKEKTAPEKMRIKMIFNNCFTQSAVMLRKSALPEEKYRDGFAPAEDYELFARILKNYKGFNLPKVLTFYRLHSENISAGGKSAKYEKDSGSEKVTRQLLSELGVNPSSEELAIHRTNFGYAGENLPEFLEKREKWLAGLIEASKKTGAYPEKLFNEVIAERWLFSCSANAKSGAAVWKIFWRSPLSKIMPLRKNFLAVLKFAAKIIL